jgi:hypothetical protein
MQRVFHDATIVARLSICFPIVLLTSITNPLENLSGYEERRWDTVFRHESMGPRDFGWQPEHIN